MKYKLSDICKYAKGKIKVSALDDNTYISTENMLPNKGGITKAVSLPTQEQTQAFMKNDVLVSNIRPYFKKIWYATFDGGCSNDVLVFRAKDGVSSSFLHYVLADDTFFDYSMATSKGTKMPRGDKKAIMEYEVPELSYEDQCKIAGILEAIDEKIELNTDINKNLADQSQAILTHFMDVYQCEFQPLSDIADIIDCLHSKKPNSEKDSSYQLIQLDNIRDDGFLDMSACKYMISAEDYRNWTRKCEIREGDCVITNVGRIGAVSQAPAGVKAAMGRNMTCIRLKDDIKLNAYLITTLLSKHMKRQIESNTDEGTIMGALNVKNIPKLLLPIFVPTRMSELERLLFPIRKQIEYNNIQNQILSQTRDTLLPHLMSGEIDISNVEL